MAISKRPEILNMIKANSNGIMIHSSLSGLPTGITLDKEITTYWARKPSAFAESFRQAQLHGSVAYPKRPYNIADP
jgi:hypothetical protein